MYHTNKYIYCISLSESRGRGDNSSLQVKEPPSKDHLIGMGIQGEQVGMQETSKGEMEAM